MEKETYQRKHSMDFEARSPYNFGKDVLEMTQAEVAKHRLLGRVLELGCGNGTYTQLIAQQAYEVLALDDSAQAVSAARKRLSSLANVRVEQRNCINTGLDDSNFDTVLMVNLLHIAPDPRVALAEAARVLKPGGKIMVLSATMAGMTFTDKLAMRYRDLMAFGKSHKYKRQLDTKSIRDLLLRSGFAVKETALMGNRTKAVWALALYMNCQTCIRKDTIDPYMPPEYILA